MSRWFPDHLSVAIEPGRLMFALGGDGAKRRNWSKTFALNDTGGATSTEMFALLTTELAALLPRHVVDFSVHSSMVRYAIVPWHHDFVSGTDRKGLVEHTFVQVFGDIARQWTLRSSDTAYRAPALAAAIDTVLIEALRQHCVVAGHQLGSIEPDLMIGFNGARSQIRDDSFWFAIIDTSSYLLLLILDGVPKVVQAARRSEGSIGMLLDRAWLSLAEDHSRCTVYAVTATRLATELNCGQWKMHWLPASTLSAPSVAKQKSLAASLS